MGRASDRLMGKAPSQGLMSQAEYARHRGCTEAAVTFAVRDGRITLIDGKIDAVKADAEWAARTDTTYQSGDKSPTLAASRARKTAAEAQIAEMKAAQTRGELVEVASASRAWYSAARVLRERLLALPDHAGPALGLTAEQVTGLRGELVRVLTDLSDTMPEAAR